MLIEQMDNDVDIPPDLTDRAQRTFANANGLARQTLGAQGLGSPQIPRPGSTPSLTPLWCARRSGSAVSRCATPRSRQQPSLCTVGAGAARAAEAREGAAPSCRRRRGVQVDS
jgi:hypothetical protein